MLVARDPQSSRARGKLQAVGFQFFFQYVQDPLEDRSAPVAGELTERVAHGRSMLAQRIGRPLVERSRRGNPDALEGQRGVLGDTIEVGVVMQNAETVSGGDRRDQVILVRESVKAGRVQRELCLCGECPVDRRGGQRKWVERLKLLTQLSVLGSGSCNRV